MKILIRKELASIFSSTTGLIFSFVFLLASGLMLWIFPGSFNILDAGYADMEKYFTLSANLFIVLIPALTMKLIAEEKKNNTFYLLRSYPFSISEIWCSKLIATFIFTTLIILSTSVYIYILYTLGSPVGNIDTNVVIVSYVSLIVLASVFIAIGLLSSAISSNQIVAFIVALLLNLIIYYGFDLLSMLFRAGNTKHLIVSCGLSYHFKQLQRGVIELSNIGVFIFYFCLSWISSLFLLKVNYREIKKTVMIGSFCSISIIVFLCTFNYRLDFTKDKRYTISEYSKNFMSEIGSDNSSPIHINIYLEGTLNYGFQRLQNATKNLLQDLNKYAAHKLDVSFISPSSLPVSREKLSQYMANIGMPGVVLNEVDRNGKLSQQIIYPYAQIIFNNDTLEVPLLKNIAGNTAEESLNASAENLEFQFVDALKVLLQKDEQNIAFIEGHGEIPRVYVYDAEEELAKYYFVNRGQIVNDISILDNFRVVIIAGSTQKFSDTEKYILDQYIMKGGRVLWLLDGVYLSHEELEINGQSPSIKNETGLDDMLFTYGVRIEPNLLQDSQCSTIIVNSDNSSQPATIPFYYSPLLFPSPDNSITKDISAVKAEFASSISFLNNSRHLSKEVLLTTSTHSRIIPVPETIDFEVNKIQNTSDYFNNSFLPVAISLSGQFQSAFENRINPKDIDIQEYRTINTSNPTKMIVVASSSIIKNDIIGENENTQILPMGFDRITGKQYGNRDFILNAINWLAADDDFFSLRSKTRQLNLLDKKKIYENRSVYALVNTLTPILAMGLIIGGFHIRRKRKHATGIKN